VILGLSMMLGLLAGMGLAVWCDRPGTEPRPAVAPPGTIEANRDRSRRGRVKSSDRMEAESTQTIDYQ
jgi:hypothetical protein